MEEEYRDTIQNLEKNQEGYHLIESNKTLLSGAPAYKLLYKGILNLTGIYERWNVPPELANLFPSDSLNSTSIIFMTVNNGLIYGITYEEIPMGSLLSGGLSFPDTSLNDSPSTNAENGFSKYLSIVEQMAKSFEITTSGPENDGQQLEGGVKLECKDHLTTLTSRLVNGQISQQEFFDIKKMIGC